MKKIIYTRTQSKLQNIFKKVVFFYLKEYFLNKNNNRVYLRHCT